MAKDYVAEMEATGGLSTRGRLGGEPIQEGAKVYLDSFYESIVKIEAEIEPLRKQMGHPEKPI